MPSRIWQRHFSWLVIAVVVAGLGIGAALAGLTRPSAPAVVALPAAGTQGGGGAFQGGGNQRASGQNGSQGGSEQAARLLPGSIVAVDPETVTIRGEQGDVKVKAADARVIKPVGGTADDLKGGTRVAIATQREPDGGYTATSVQILAASQAGARGTSSQGSGGAASPSGGTGGAQGGPRGQGQAAQGGTSGARPITGTISSFDGGILTVAGPQGDTRIKLGSASIQKMVDGSTKDLQPGQQVLVMGQQGTDGSLGSAEIQIVTSVDARTAPPNGQSQ